MLTEREQKTQKRARSHRAAGKARADSDWLWMAEGPQVVDGKVVIPSAWYSAEAAGFWRSLGARFVKEWTRDNADPLGGPNRPAWVLDPATAFAKDRLWTAAQWLVSVQRKYTELWGSRLEE